MIKTKLISSSKEFYSPSQWQFNVALKYSEIDSCLCVSIFKCRLRVRKLKQCPISLLLYQVPQITLADSSKMYSKITLLMDSKELLSKKQNKCFQNEDILDFSKEHKFKISKDLIENYIIKIQIKKTTNFGVKSKKLKYDMRFIWILF